MLLGSILNASTELSNQFEMHNHIGDLTNPVCSEPYHKYFPHLDFIVLPDGHGPDPVLGPELLGERSGHQASSDVRRG